MRFVRQKNSSSSFRVREVAETAAYWTGPAIGVADTRPVIADPLLEASVGSELEEGATAATRAD